jgi:6-pyruvoyl tetrahydropterin synthase/QueD family protein
MMYKVRREYDFSAAHRLKGHPKCGRLHGHNYHVWVTIGHDQVTHNGMLIDFSDIDKIVKPIIEKMDHKYLKSRDEQLLWTFPQDIYELDTVASTAECIAMHICVQIQIALPWAKLVQVDVGENRRSVASYVSR